MRLFLRYFVRTLGIFLVLWALMVGALLHNSWEWRTRDIQSQVMSAVRSVSSAAQEGALRRTLNDNCYVLSPYGGMLLLRTYDRYGGETGRSQLLAGAAIDGSAILDVFFDPVLTEAEQLETARILAELGDSNLLYLGKFWISGYADLTGVLEGGVLYPQKVVLHNEGAEDAVLLDLEPERLEGRETVTLERVPLQLYGALLGSGSPEERLETYHRLEEQLDTLKERNAWPDLAEPYLVSILPGGRGTTALYSGDPAVAYSYQVDRLYPIYGLEPVCGLTLLAAVALAAFTAWIQTRAVRREREFTRAAAHELKTPLAVLRTHAEALREDIAPARRADYLEVILDESDRMSALVGRLLDLSRLEAGAPLRWEPVDLAELVQEVCRRLEPVAQGKGVALTLELSPAQVAGDRDRLASAAEELAANAIRHCPAGGNVGVRLTREGKRVYLWVENDGEPIPDGALARLWEPFFKADPARSRAQGGTGLGLSLVQAAAKRHGGTCSAANRPGGVRFVVELPALQSQE